MLNEYLDELRPKPKVDPWEGKRYQWLRLLAPVKIGEIGATLYLRAFEGARVMGSAATYDIEHEGKLIEAKTAMRAVQKSYFRYQWAGFRKDDPWTHAWLVAVSYDRVRGFLVPRADMDLKKMKESNQAYWVGNKLYHDT